MGDAVPRDVGALAPGRTLRAEGLYVLGAGGHGAVVVDLARACGEVVTGVLDDRVGAGADVLGAPVVGTTDDLPVGARCVLAVGEGSARRGLDAQLAGRAVFATLVHPHAWLSPSAIVGEGAVVMAGAVVHARAVLGRHAVVNTGASVDHDARLGAFAQVAPGARLGGGACVDDGGFVGMQAVLLPRTRVGAWTMVGAGAVVTRDLPAHVVAVGVPARVRRAVPPM